MFNLQNIIYTILHDLRILLNKILFGKRINLFCGKVFFPGKVSKTNAIGSDYPYSTL